MLRYRRFQYRKRWSGLVHPWPSSAEGGCQTQAKKGRSPRMPLRWRAVFLSADRRGQNQEKQLLLFLSSWSAEKNQKTFVWFLLQAVAERRPVRGKLVWCLQSVLPGGVEFQRGFQEILDHIFLIEPAKDDPMREEEAEGRVWAQGKTWQGKLWRCPACDSQGHWPPLCCQKHPQEGTLGKRRVCETSSTGPDASSKMCFDNHDAFPRSMRILSSFVTELWHLYMFFWTACAGDFNFANG